MSQYPKGTHAEVIADSVGPNGVRLTTMTLKYPRYIHAEFMTHRMFARNAASSRAKPIETVIREVRKDTARPPYWGANRKGMQAGEEVTPRMRAAAFLTWNFARDVAIISAKAMSAFGCHKQIANRILEPFHHIIVLATATDEGWANFHTLRAHEAAAPEMQAVGVRSAVAYRESTPRELAAGEWHMPYVSPDDRFALEDDTAKLLQVSVARCARLSYATFENPDKPSDIESDLKLYKQLVGSHPKHASPAEHQAEALPKHNAYAYDPDICGCLPGWAQYRKLIDGERARTFDYHSAELDAMARRWIPGFGAPDLPRNRIPDPIDV